MAPPSATGKPEAGKEAGRGRRARPLPTFRYQCERITGQEGIALPGLDGMGYSYDYQQILEAVAAVLQFDVTLVNDRLERVAGTGPVRARVGERLHPDTAFGHALASGQPVQVSNPRIDLICQGCGARPTCGESAHVAHPIVSDGVPVGVLGFLAFTMAQRQRLLHDLERYVDFLSKISHLLSAKLQEEKSARALLTAQGSLQAVADSVAEGLIATDAAGTITFVNGPAERLLGLQGRDRPGEITGLSGLAPTVLEVLRGGSAVTNQEFSITTPHGLVRVMGNILPIRVGEKVAGSVTSLRELSEVYSLANQLHTDLPALGLEHITYQSSAMERVVERVRRVAASHSTVLIRGESGTGKELLARALHGCSPRKQGPFLAINCAAIPEELLESELFGYADGAFTGARRGGKPGKFELAHGGTLFLDEIGDMSLRLQAKLLRVLQDGEVTRVGATRPTRLDVRILAATHQNLEELMERREFRADLFYRLNVIPLEIPPLRERKEDILVLAEHFRVRQAQLQSKPLLGFSPAVRQALVRYAWPGNVRELENVVEYLATMTNGPVVEVDCLPTRLLPAEAPSAVEANGAPQEREERLTPLGELERRELERGLALYGSGEKAVIRIAAELGISRATVYRRLRHYGLMSEANISV